jgi:hypothetical protein
MHSSQGEWLSNAGVLRCGGIGEGLERVRLGGITGNERGSTDRGTPLRMRRVLPDSWLFYEPPLRPYLISFLVFLTT